ncbi:MAG: glutathione S-transferase family protein [Porticoccaceae bacterium]|nr:glutathione S-transferase family protein [Porticoccaceae bacterium]
MFKLYGFPVSNYYNMVKLALLEKGLEFEEVLTRPSQKEDFLQKSPMGKVPCLVVDEGPLSETDVILDFLEELSSDINFYPVDPYQKAKVKELMKSTELYLELVARRLLGALFFDQSLSEELKTEITGQLEKGAKALNKLLKFEPYAAGAERTYADIVLYYTVALSNLATQKVLDINLEDKLPGLHTWLELMGENSFVQAVDADQNEALKAMAG